MTSETGSPVPFARLELDYAQPDGTSPSPDCTPGGCVCDHGGCFRVFETDAGGRYSLEFEPGVTRTGRIGLVYTLHPDYETNVQAVFDGASAIELNLTLRSVRVLTPGEATLVEIDARSTRCTDLEDWWLLDHRCAVLRVVAERPGLLGVTGRAAVGSWIVPRMFAATSGNYGPGVGRIEPGSLYIPVRGGTYFIFIGLPDGTPPQRLEVSASLQ